MSAPHNHSGHDDHHGDHGHGHEDEGHHGSLKDYAIGFVLSVILTAIPFWLVMGKKIDSSATMGFVLLGIAAVQVVVHMIYFLHMDGKVEGGWSMLAMVFTIMVVVVMLSGSLWVMYHMNHNMIPGVMPAEMVHQ